MNIRTLLSTAVLLSGLLLQPLAGLATSLRISQIDASQQLLSQKVRLFVSVIDKSQTPLKHLNQAAFKVLEAGLDQKFEPVPAVSGFRVGANYETGVHLMLLLDNSQSMYRKLKGPNTRTRISHATDAIRAVLADVINPRDRMGLAVYNSFYRLLAPISHRIGPVEEHIINDIHKPEKDAGYRETYGSLMLAGRELKTLRGRKAIIILTNGVNDPYVERTDKPHPVFGQEPISSEETLRTLQHEGISVHAIHFGHYARDHKLKKITVQTGGDFSEANGQPELETVFRRIMDRIVNEYVITYTTVMIPAEKKRVRVEFQQDKEMVSTQRLYAGSTVLGLPLKDVRAWLILPFAAAVFMLWGLIRLKFVQKEKGAALEVLGKLRRKASPPVLAITGKETVIGGSKKDDLFLGGMSEVRAGHAVLVFDDVKQTYLLSARGDLTVNNNPVTQKSLEPGDVIKIDEAVIVFDDGNQTQ